MNHVVCVLIPHFNDPSGLYRTLESIDPEDPVDICIVDDGSSNKPDRGKVTSSYKGTGKVHILRLGKNKGIACALNEGLSFIGRNLQYEFIARIDCGDTAIAKRFSIQLDFMRSNPDIALCGTSISYIDSDGKTLFSTSPKTTHRDIYKQFYTRNPFAHPSVIFRSTLISEIGGYSENYQHIEDYVFFFETAKKFKTANLRETLTNYSVDEGSITGKNRKKQLFNMTRYLLKTEKPSMKLYISAIYLILKTTISRGQLISIKKSSKKLKNALTIIFEESHHKNNKL